MIYYIIYIDWVFNEFKKYFSLISELSILRVLGTLCLNWENSIKIIETERDQQGETLQIFFCRGSQELEIPEDSNNIVVIFCSCRYNQSYHQVNKRTSQLSFWFCFDQWTVYKDGYEWCFI